MTNKVCVQQYGIVITIISFLLCIKLMFIEFVGASSTTFEGDDYADGWLSERGLQIHKFESILADPDYQMYKYRIST